MGMKAEPATADLKALLAQAGWLRRFARALVGGAADADDLAQDALISAWRQPTGAGRAWLATVARNLSFDGFRREARRERREAAARASTAGFVTSPEELIGHAEIHRDVAEAVARLVEPFRQVVVLRFYEGLSSAEIARRLAKPEGTIRWRLKEALDRVRADLDARYGHDRTSWRAALVPLVSRSASPTRSGDGPSRAGGGRGGWEAWYLCAGAVGTLSVLLGALAISPRWRRPGGGDRPLPVITRPLDSEPPQMAARPARSYLPTDPTEVPEAALSQSFGPREADALSLAEELLQALQDDDYDAFVAKGSPSFRSALGTAHLARAAEALGERLSRRRRVSPLGSLRRTAAVSWLFKVEFADDDALITLTMDGWQVAGFLVTDPIPMPPET